MFKVFVNDGSKKIPKDDIVYIVCKEGVYLKKKVGIMESITPVKGLSHLQPVETMAQMHIEKMPGYMFAKVIDFFRKVYEEHKAEAVVLLFYDMETDEYEIVVPPQKVNGASADYTKGFTIENMDMIGTIHSHAGMSAFHSGVDDKDEESFDGIHITIGNLNDDDVSISASIVSNGTRFIVDPEEYIKDLEKVVDIDEEVSKPYRKVFKFVNGKMVESKSNHTYTTRKYDKRYASKFLKRSKESQGIFDKEWMEKVEYKSYVYTYKNVYGWGGDFQSSFWKNRGVQNAFTGFNKQKALPLKTESKETKTKDIPVAGEMNPCMECVFKAHKIDWVMEQIATGVEVEDKNLLDNFIYDENFGTEDMLVDTYHCEKCNSVFQSEDLDCECPVCKTDEHLVDVTGDVDLDDEDILDASFSAADEAGFDDILKTCPACDNKFMYNGGDDVCPFCYTEITETSEETIKNTCLECGHTFEYKLGDTNCPHCGVPIPKLGEESIDYQMRSDSGEFLDPDYQKVMDAAIAADNEKRLPIPGEDETPIDKPGVFSFMRLTRKRKKNRKKK